MERESVKTENEISKSEIEVALGSISKQDWEDANWPIITYASKEVYPQEGEPVNKNFWEQILNPENFMCSDSPNSYDPGKHLLFVLHALPNPDKKDEEDSEIYKAVFTTMKSFVGNPHHMVKYRLHGAPCEARSRGNSYYSQIRFWKDFHDKLPEKKQDKYPIPTVVWRKKFISEKILKEKS